MLELKSKVGDSKKMQQECYLHWEQNRVNVGFQSDAVLNVAHLGKC